MIAKHLRIVHLVDMVARKNKNIFGGVLVNERCVLINCIRRAGIPPAAAVACIRRQNKHAAVISVQIPCLSVPEIRVQRKRLILRQHTNGVDIRIHTV